jgi:hypothetical protein
MSSSIPPDDSTFPPDFIPDPDSVRRRLAVLITETNVLRRQLLVSVKLAKERERLASQARQHEGGVS